MHQFKDYNNQFYHEQKFTLQWDFPEAFRVFVRYFNGNTRVLLPIVTDSSKQIADGSKFKILNSLLWIFRKTKRSYRYKRFFVFKAKDEFTNVANFRSQFIQLFILSKNFPWIKSVKVQMHVKLLRISESRMSIGDVTVDIAPQDFHSVKPDIYVRPNFLSFQNSIFEVQMPMVDVQFAESTACPIINDSINNLIATGKISEQTSPESILQLIN